MSINLASVDLTSASTGTNGIVKLPFPAVQTDELAHLRVYNESGCGLTILFDNGHQEVIPAGAWPMFEIEPVVRQYVWTVTYVLPNAPVALLSAVYYFPYEGVPPTPALGNSPIGVTGGVTTSSVQTLSNETAVLGTKIIDIGTLTIGDLLDIFNDHFTWSVQQAGIAHTVLQGKTSGNPLLLGQVNDTSEVLGSLAVDGSVKTNTLRDNTNGVDLIDLAATLVTINQLLTVVGQITGAAAQDLTLNAVTGHQVRALINNVLAVTMDATGIGIAGKKLFDTSSNNLADWSADGVYIKGNQGNPGRFHYQQDATNTDFSIQALSVVSFNTVNGTTATINHNLKVANVGVTPDAIVANAFSNGVSAANVTIGLSEVGATTFKATSIAAVPAKAICVKF